MSYVRILRGALVISLGFAFQALADDAHHPKIDATSTTTNAAASGLSEGEVRKVDKEAGKVTIKHGPLTKLDMPAMTMVFHVKDPATLDQLKAGDKIRFEADKINGAYTVIRFEAAK